MPSSIKLAVILTEQSKANLRDVWLEASWEDLMRSMTFSSSKPSLQMEDVAEQVETYIENIYQARYKGQWGQIQVQVFKMMNQAGNKELFFKDNKDNVNQHFNPGDTLVVELDAVSTSNQAMQQEPEFTEEMIEKARSLLRFGLNDRVLCNCGPRWLLGHVVGTAVPDDELIPYLVKTDALPGLPSGTISVPSDDDGCCIQEVCFDPATQLDLVRCAAAVVTESRKPKLRFAVGDDIACRIRNNPEDGLENWVRGCITEVWPNIGVATWDMGEATGKFSEIVPYKVNLASDKWVYCHRDDHTLIRRQGMQPRTRIKGTSKRMETVTEEDGRRIRIDHVTERRKVLLDEVCDTD